MNPVLQFVLVIGALAAVAYVGAYVLDAIVNGLPTGPRVRTERGSIDTFIPEYWAKKLLSEVEKALVICAPGVFNRDYEGEISEAGDTVKINSVSDPTIFDYVPGSTVIVPEQLTTAQRSLVIDQAKAFAFEIDDIDKRQAADGNGVMTEGMKRAAYRLRDVADRYGEALLRTGVDPTMQLGAVSITAATDVYNKLLVPLSVRLGENDVPTEGRYVLIPEWVYGFLLLDDRFIRADASGVAAASVNGKVGRAANFEIRVSNNLPVVTGDDSSVIAGIDQAATFAEQINKTEAYRPQDSFSDAVKGLQVYGGKVVRPKMIATALASKT